MAALAKKVIETMTCRRCVLDGNRASAWFRLLRMSTTSRLGSATPTSTPLASWRLLDGGVRHCPPTRPAGRRLMPPSCRTCYDDISGQINGVRSDAT